jgi:hypothetical protein
MEKLKENLGEIEKRLENVCQGISKRRSANSLLPEILVLVKIYPGNEQFSFNVVSQMSDACVKMFFEKIYEIISLLNVGFVFFSDDNFCFRGCKDDLFRDLIFQMVQFSSFLFNVFCSTQTSFSLNSLSPVIKLLSKLFFFRDKFNQLLQFNIDSYKTDFVRGLPAYSNDSTKNFKVLLVSYFEKFQGLNCIRTILSKYGNIIPFHVIYGFVRVVRLVFISLGFYFRLILFLRALRFCLRIVHMINFSWRLSCCLRDGFVGMLIMKI